MRSNLIWRGCAAAGALGLAGCAATTSPPATPLRPAPAGIGSTEVIGQTAAGLTRLFGVPDADMREGTARKLQFQGPFCVLDTYLYPGKSGPEPVVTYIDAREPDGSTIDKASCVGAMLQRPKK